MESIGTTKWKRTWRRTRERRTTVKEETGTAGREGEGGKEMLLVWEELWWCERASEESGVRLWACAEPTMVVEILRSHPGHLTPFDNVENGLPYSTFSKQKALASLGYWETESWRINHF